LSVDLTSVDEDNLVELADQAKLLDAARLCCVFFFVDLRYVLEARDSLAVLRRLVGVRLDMAVAKIDRDPAQVGPPGRNAFLVSHKLTVIDGLSIWLLSAMILQLQLDQPRGVIFRRRLER